MNKQHTRRYATKYGLAALMMALLVLMPAMIYAQGADDTPRRPRGLSRSEQAMLAKSEMFEHMSASQHKVISDSLERVLKKTESPKERLKVMYDIYDLSSNETRANDADRLYQAAKQARDTTAMLESLRYLSNATQSDSIRRIAQQRAEVLPLSADQRETVTYIRLARVRAEATALSDEQRSERLHEMLVDFDDDDKADIYRRIEMLGSITSYLQFKPYSQLLIDYVDETSKLIDMLPHYPGALRRQHYNIAAITKTVGHRHAEALAADSVLLDIMDDQHVRHVTDGRLFRQNETNRYRIYRRMMMNAAQENPDLALKYYDEILNLADNNEGVRTDLNQQFLTSAYYYMAQGKYAQALPLLKKAANNPANHRYLYTLLQTIIFCAQQVGDTKTLLESYREYVPMVEAMTNTLEADRVLQHEILQDIHSLELTNENLVAKNEALESDSQEQLIIFGVILTIVLLSLSMWLYHAYRREKRASLRLEEAKILLEKERDHLKQMQNELIQARDDARVAERQKSDFINTISHEVSEPMTAILGYSQLIVDGIEEKRRKVYDRFIKIIELNANLLQTLVNDVLDVSELENSVVVVKRERVPMDQVCELAVEPMLKRLAPGVKLEVRPLTPDDAGASVDTDRTRTEQILVNLISNAIKFTGHGHIYVYYGLDKEHDVAKFVVEDTGPGIPDEMHAMIFDRFTKLSSSNHGAGLGLYICRLVAKILEGRVYIDPEYRSGTRMVLELPLNPSSGTTSSL